MEDRWPRASDDRTSPDKAGRVYLDIKAVLLSHRLPPSTFLNIKTIARVLKLSQTPVREALARLVHEELVLQAPSGRGYFCRPFRIDELACEFEAACVVASYALLEQRHLASQSIRAIVGLNVSKIRHEQQLSQEQLSLRAKLTRAYLSGVEAGTRNPTVEVVARLADALGVAVEALVKHP